MAPRKTRKSPAKKTSTASKVSKAVHTATTVATAVEAAETVVKAAETAKAVVKTAETAKKVAIAAGTAEVVKKTAGKIRKSTADAKKDPTVGHFFEIDQDQIKTDDIVEKIYAAHKAAGHQIGRIKKLDIYYNFVERKAYYVINDKPEGGFVEF